MRAQEWHDVAVVAAVDERALASCAWGTLFSLDNGDISLCRMLPLSDEQVGEWLERCVYVQWSHVAQNGGSMFTAI